MPIVRPKPRHASHAPTGELNEKLFGTQSPYAMSHCAQCRCAENLNARPLEAPGGVRAGSSASRTVTWPPPTFSAVSSASISRARLSSVNASRSWMTSMRLFVRAWMRV